MAKLSHCQNYVTVCAVFNLYWCHMVCNWYNIYIYHPLLICFLSLKGYPNIVATYGRGYTGFAPSYSYQFPGKLMRKILALQPISVLLSQAAQSDTLAHAYTKDGQCTRQSPNNLQGYKCASCLDSSTKFWKLTYSEVNCLLLFIPYLNTTMTKCLKWEKFFVFSGPMYANSSVEKPKNKHLFLLADF